MFAAVTCLVLFVETANAKEKRLRREDMTLEARIGSPCVPCNGANTMATLIAEGTPCGDAIAGVKAKVKFMKGSAMRRTSTPLLCAAGLSCGPECGANWPCSAYNTVCAGKTAMVSAQSIFGSAKEVPWAEYQAKKDGTATTPGEDTETVTTYAERIGVASKVASALFGG